MQTPPGSPVRAPRSPREGFGTPFGSPMSPVRRAFSERNTPVPPTPAKKRRGFVDRRINGVREGEPVGSPKPTTLVGRGSFATVFGTDKTGVVSKTTPVTPDGVKHSISSRQAEEEAALLGSSSVIPGICWQIGGEELWYLLPELGKVSPGDIQGICEAIDGAPLEVVVDAKPENFGVLEVGTPVPYLNGNEVAYRVADRRQVLFLDFGVMEGDNEGDGDWAALRAGARVNIRAFKKALLCAWAANPDEDPQERRRRVEAQFP